MDKTITTNTERRDIMSLMEELEKEHAKDGMFDSSDIGMSYPLGFPILDQMLGFKQSITLPDGTEIIQKRLGVPAGTITEFVGPSQSGKTAAAIQAAYNITEPFADDAIILHFDAEGSTEAQRVLDLTGMNVEEYRNRYKLMDKAEKMTFENILKSIVELGKFKKERKELLTYDTGCYDIHGNKIFHYVPSVVILDSLMRITPDSTEMDKIEGLTSGGRDAIFRGKFLRNILAVGREYNINIFIINHYADEMNMNPMQPKAKKLIHIPTGKTIPGGDKNLYYITSLVVFNPVNSKDQVKHEEEEGYNGRPVKALIAKSRSGPGGYTALLEFVEEAGYDPRFTLLNLAKDKGLIQGRNPKCYFVSNPDVKFDTRIFLKELTENPDILRALFEGCKPILDSMLREPVSEDDFMRGRNTRIQTRGLMKDLYS